MENTFITVKELIKANTEYDYQQQPICLKCGHLGLLIANIAKINETCEVIRIFPRYINHKVGMNKKYNTMNFKIECKDNVSKKECDQYLLEQREKGNQYHYLCESDDTIFFNECLKKYFDDITAFMKDEMKKLIEEGLEVENILFGYFGFDVYST